MAKKKFSTFSSHGKHCQDCEHAYDYHEKDIKGEFFMCKCPFFTYSRFLRHDFCSNFKDNGEE